MSIIGEYTSRFDADVAAARLLESGFESTVLSENWAAPHDGVESSFHLVVRDEVADHASELLAGGRAADHEADELDAMYHHRTFADRPNWVRWATWTIIIAIPGTLLLTAAVQALAITDRLFP
jgi:hypothetical protein